MKADDSTKAIVFLFVLSSVGALMVAYLIITIGWFPSGFGAFLLALTFLLALNIFALSVISLMIIRVMVE